ncbi:H(+)/Cl(-) exchange transporter 7-like isoform X1 [Anopheles albimanus]|uniref:H(+)/Cl(-) exchange transporter 7-like isoform X1 n=1 Tax=Anopheles albimanus TaxID=7167 RepID=UPI00163FA17C|nr:H(+)/Cl(-) exchange transporter 7-like isoform X1 [Anopheles albimanus]
MSRRVRLVHLDEDSDEDNNIRRSASGPPGSHPTDFNIPLTDDSSDPADPAFRTARPPKKEPSQYESLDYDVCENVLWRRDQTKIEPKFTVRKDFARWVISFQIGVCTALVACCINIAIEEVSRVKYGFLKQQVDRNVIHGDLSIPYLYWALTNLVPVVIGSTLVAYVEPVAAGSGIPQVKCYLNGVKVPRIVRIKTLAVKAVGVATSVIGGLAGGKEGPMIHSGAVIAAGISQGKSTTFRRDLKVLQYFRDDHEKRDFVVGGAAAGVAAAFGAPIGGTLFSLEEAASFWNQALIWRTFFASIISSFTLNIILSAYHGLSSFRYRGLFNLGEFEPLPFDYFELPIFMLMGVVGGCSGALWNAVNRRLNMFRAHAIRPRWAKVLEAAFVAVIGATFACLMAYTINDCRPLGNDPTEHPVQLFCQDNEYNAAAALWFQTPEATVKALFHDPPGSHQLLTLIVFVAIYYPLSCVTYGLSVSLGIFIPTLLIGAAWGRLTGTLIIMGFPASSAFVSPGKYALIGAAAQLGGVVRMTLSLSVIILETTGNIGFILPIILTLMAAKWSGDYFNEGIYDSQIRMSRVPMLPWHVEPEFQQLSARSIMAQPVVCVRVEEKVQYLLDILKNTTHNGFPVVEDGDDGSRVNGRVIGLILRSQLVVILKRSFYQESSRFWESTVNIEAFRDEYPRYPAVGDLHVSEDKLSGDFTVNMSIFMNPSPHSVEEGTSVPRLFQLFRALGLRHLIVVSVENRVRGIITRKDFLKHL